MNKLASKKIEKIVKLYKNGKTLAEVSTILKVNVSTVSKYIKKKKIMRSCSEAKTGRKILKFTDEHKRKIGMSNKNKKRTKETKEKLSKAKINKYGEETNNWKGGKTPLNQLIRHSFKNKAWIHSTFERNNYTCKVCKKRGGNLNAHHIKLFNIIIKENNIKTLKEAIFCDDLWNLSNGITLCEKCHKKEHKRR